MQSKMPMTMLNWIILTNCTYVAGDANKIVPRWKKKGINFDVAIVDPPRVGLGHLAKNLLNVGC